MMKLLLILLVFIVIQPNKAFSCLAPSMEEHTFLSKLPEKANEKDIVALVKILDVKGGSIRVSNVMVIEPIKNTKKNQKFKVKERIHSCARPYELIVGNTYYIAGKKSFFNVFKGEWNAADAEIW